MSDTDIPAALVGVAASLQCSVCGVVYTFEWDGFDLTEHEVLCEDCLPETQAGEHAMSDVKEDEYTVFEGHELDCVVQHRATGLAVTVDRFSGVAATNRQRARAQVEHMVKKNAEANSLLHQVMLGDIAHEQAVQLIACMPWRAILEVAKGMKVAGPWKRTKGSLVRESVWPQDWCTLNGIVALVDTTMPGVPTTMIRYTTGYDDGGKPRLCTAASVDDAMKQADAALRATGWILEDAPVVVDDVSA